MLRLVRPVAVLVDLVVCALLAAAPASPGEVPAVTRAESVARSSPCDRPPDTALAYGWPVRPFRRQHPVRGNFGDPRTQAGEGKFGADTPLSPGKYSFHNGIDVSAPVGTPVYPVVSGIASVRSAEEVVVDTSDFRTFQYWHITPSVRSGQHVVAYRTVLGRIRREAHHVHLTEIDGFRVHNPADPGHIEPYRDHTAPSVLGLEFKDLHGRRVDSERLRGRVRIAADARDVPPIRVPGVWFDYPVTPALVRWRLTDASGHLVVPAKTVADFRTTEPPNRDFWRVYAAGTYQNFPVFGHHLFWRASGRYLFNLTPRPLDTTRLPSGTYTITVRVADACGNRGSLTEPVRITQ